MNLVAMQVTENQRNLKMTVLYRQGGVWHPSEISQLMRGLKTETSRSPKHPEYLVLFGHYTKEETLKALLGGQAYTAVPIVGVDSEKLPFVPGFI